jgi:hypothetical protein
VRMADGAATGGIRTLLRIEGAAAFVLAVGLYAHGGYGWLLFAILILVPDLSMLGFLAGPRAGAIAYNAVHSYIGPLLLASGMTFSGGSFAVPLVWVAHIGIDRALGYGLKYPAGFRTTHLGAIGRHRDEE